MRKKTTLFVILSAWGITAGAQDSSVPVNGPAFTPCQVKALVMQDGHERGSLPVIFSCDTLQTTFAGGNNHRGNMFDITAINTVTITSFDGSPQGNTGYEIYYRTGTYVGAENNPSAWTLVGSATNVVSNGSGVPTPLAITVNVTIPQGQTYGFYISSTNTSVSQDYTDGTGVGNVYVSDANIQHREGCGLEYPFSGSPFTPRVWNGRIHYCNGSVGSEEQVISTYNPVVLPNPLSTGGVIRLASGTFSPSMKILIRDVTGRTVHTLSSLSGNEAPIQREVLANGLYFYELVEHSTALAKGKFIVH